MPMAYGERFLHDIYSALIDSPRWGKSVLIYTYDEHGGFLDHVEPLNIGYTPRDNKFKHFPTTGPRDPADVVSPMVGSKVRQEPFDHTSILQLLAERFGDPAAPISAAVTARRGQVASISTLLDAALSRKDIPAPPAIAEPRSSMMPVIQPLPHDLQIAFAQAALEVVKLYGWGAKVFPEIITWLHANK